MTLASSVMSIRALPAKDRASGKTARNVGIALELGDQRAADAARSADDDGAAVGLETAQAHQPMLPGAPLNGPTRSRVTQPP